MNLKEYVEKLNTLLEESPELASATVVYSSDDEGNNFSRVKYDPSCGQFEDGEWIGGIDVIGQYNAVCIN